MTVTGAIFNYTHIGHAAASQYQHQSNGQVETCIKFFKLILKRCFDTNAGTYLALLQGMSAY